MLQYETSSLGGEELIDTTKKAQNNNKLKEIQEKKHE